jgi:pimeloyl-ACP methyl ester carboxylesterase
MTNDFQWIRAAGVAALVRPGEGGTVVIVPGAMADAEGWLPCATALRTPQSVAIMNRRGRAPSVGLPPGATVTDEVEDVRALLSCLKGPFVLVGWSYGGLLAMEAAIGLAGITSIILYEPVSRPFMPAAIEPIRRYVEAGDLDQAVAEIITRVGGASEAQFTALRDTPAWAYLKPLAIPAATELLALNRYDPNFTAYAVIKAPITVLIGSENQNREPYGTAAMRFLDALPLASVVTLQGQGHLAHVEAPTQLAETINAILHEQALDN